MPKNTINSVGRVLAILERFAYEKKEWSLNELSVSLSLPASTLHRHLTTLIELGYIKHQGDAKPYEIGGKLISVASAVVSKNDLRNLARPELRRLADEVGETIHLCQLIDFDMFYLDKVESIHSVSCTSIIGSRIPAHAAGAGKVLLSGLPLNKLEEYCSLLPGLPVYTQNTIRSSEELKSNLASIRRLGYGIDNEEKEEGLYCVAAPIYDYNAEIIAAISISGPAFRLRGNVERYITTIKHKARNISRLMGYQN